MLRSIFDAHTLLLASNSAISFMTLLWQCTGCLTISPIICKAPCHCRWPWHILPMHSADAVHIRFCRSPLMGGLELMHARFNRHQFSRHAHDGYALGVIEYGAPAFGIWDASIWPSKMPLIWSSQEKSTTVTEPMPPAGSTVCSICRQTPCSRQPWNWTFPSICLNLAPAYCKIPA